MYSNGDFQFIVDFISQRIGPDVTRLVIAYHPFEYFTPSLLIFRYKHQLCRHINSIPNMNREERERKDTGIWDIQRKLQSNITGWLYKSDNQEFKL